MASDLRIESVTRAALASDDDRAIGLARLIWSAGEGFYCLISPTPDVILPVLSLQVAMPGTELRDVIALRCGAEDIGVIASTDLSMLASAQSASLAQIVRHLRGDDRARFIEALRQYSATVEPVVGEGRYVSRVAMAPNVQGRGHGRRMMRWFIDKHGAAPITLHVHKDNEAAIGLYQSLGFARMSDRNFAYLAFIRSADRVH